MINLFKKLKVLINLQWNQKFKFLFLKNKFSNFIILTIIFIFTRFLFLANYPHFYDSPEYLRESLGTNFYLSLAKSHESVHPIWLYLSQVFQKINIDSTAWEISLISAISGLITIFAFYFFIKILFKQRIADKALLPLIFFPHLWLIQTNIMHESIDVALFISALLFYLLFIDKNKFIYFFFSLTCLTMAFLDFIGIAIWVSAFIGLIVYRSKGNVFKNLFIYALELLLSISLSIVFLYLLLNKAIDNPLERLNDLLFVYGKSGIFEGWSLLNIIRMFRNNLFVLYYGYSLAAIVAIFIVFFNLIKNKKNKLLLFIISFFIPFFLTGKFWYGGLYGRYSIMIAFPLALILALIKNKKIYWSLMGILIFYFGFTFCSYLKTPIPEIQRDLIKKAKINESDLIILSDYQRPQLNLSNAVFINGDLQEQIKTESLIEESLFDHKKVFISQQAIDFPYWQYDGQEIHIISKSNSDKAVLNDFINGKELDLVTKNNNYPLLNIYQIKR